MRSDEARAEIEAVYYRYAAELQALFVMATARGSNYPYLGHGDFVNFCQQAGIVDKRGACLATIDRLFIAADFEQERLINNEKKLLMRFEFIEALVRLAKSKYSWTGATTNLAEAFE